MQFIFEVREEFYQTDEGSRTEATFHVHNPAYEGLIAAQMDGFGNDRTKTYDDRMRSIFMLVESVQIDPPLFFPSSHWSLTHAQIFPIS